MNAFTTGALAVSLCLPGCAAFKQTARTINDAASLLCASSPDMQEMAQAQGVSVEDLCTVHSVLAPFIDEALRAQKAGARKAGAAR